MKFYSLIISFLLSISATVWSASETIVSRLFPIGQTEQKPLYTQTTQIEKNGPESFTSNARIEDAKGQIMMTEVVVVKEGTLVSQKVTQLQTSQAWDLAVQAKKATYQSFKLKGDGSRDKTSENSVEMAEDFINGPMIELFIVKHWQTLIEGKTVKAHLSVLELEKPVSFEFKKEADSSRGGQKVLVVQMRPANFLIAMLVDPIRLEFSYEGKRLVYFKGRTPLKIQEGGKNIPLDAEILYSVQ
ncbi:MAG: hypothetical protein JSU04_19325 [Bdellovibrionales bacterium]|nr:hypothetical protein [Bdellovibrionales bacterium]